MTTIRTHTFDNGLVLATETNPSVASAAFSLRLPLGSSRDPGRKVGLCAILEEMLLRGSTRLTSREQSDAFDALGASRSTSTATFHTVISSTTTGEKLSDVLPLLAEMARSPRFEPEAFAAVREVCLQTVRALPDDPQELVMYALRDKHAPPPINRPSIGTVEGLTACDPADPAKQFAELAKPGGSFMAVAGRVDHDAVVGRIGELFGDWSGAASEPTWDDDAAPRGYHHVRQETNQTHIAVAFDAPAESDDRSVLERLAVAVLSGGMSGRLFTEVREKRGLCYAVHASYSTTKAFGRVTAYVGTTPERAQESVDVLLGELRSLGQGDRAVTAEEFARAKTGLKSRLVMSGESTRARANALASDLYRLGRTRTLDEMADRIDAATLDDLNAYLAQRSMGEMTVVSVGPGEVVVGD